jgi:hypothetical protein
MIAEGYQVKCATLAEVRKLPGRQAGQEIVPLRQI